jgi:hypothetical protein
VKIGQRLEVSGWQASHELGNEEMLRDMAQVGAKRGLKMGQRLGVSGWHASHELRKDEVFRDMS